MREPNQPHVQPALTPCISLCGLNSDGFCRGCARTIDEISQWRLLSDEDKRTIMAELPRRKQSFIGN
ncbi:MAG: DUF1289 domain-containing protein [Shewanella sp.]